MHEVSIAVNLVEIADQAARREGAERVATVYLKVGALSGVVCDALSFAFDIAKENTLLDGANLEIEEVPVIVYCPVCREERQLLNNYIFSCPVCDSPTPELRRGRELEITALEII